MSATAIETLDLGTLELRELNGRPVGIRSIGGVGKCSLCDNIAKWTVFEFWHGKRLKVEADKLHRVWHWCGQCADEKEQTSIDAR